MSIETLSDVPLYAARPSRRVEPQRKAISWITVGLVHLLFLNALLLVSYTFPSLLVHGSQTETIIDISGSRNQTDPRELPIVPEVRLGAPPEVQVPPPPVLLPPAPPTQPLAPPAGGEQRGDVLGALGREIACSAGHYENLTEAQRNRCGRIPWQGAMAPSGEIVLANPARMNRFAPPPPEYAVRGQDAQRLQVERAQIDDCPAALLNVPCVRLPRQGN